jgi:GNAT superfamily N-acetyltransferase
MMVRTATAADALAVGSFHRHLYQFHHEHAPVFFKGSAGSHGVEAGADLETTLVFDDGGRVVGFVSYGLHEVKESPTLHRRNMVVVFDLFVADEARHRGIGRSLLEAVDRVALGLGCDSVEIPVFSFNRGALGFYQRLGYVEYLRRLRKSLVPVAARPSDNLVATVVYFDIRRFSLIDRSRSGDQVYEFLSDFHRRLSAGATALGLDLYRVQSDTAVYWSRGPASPELVPSLAALRESLGRWFASLGFSSVLAVAVTFGPLRTGTIRLGDRDVFDLSGPVMGQLERLIQFQARHPDPQVADGLVTDADLVQ